MEDDLTVYRDIKGRRYTATGPMKSHFVQVKCATTTEFVCECTEGANKVVLQLWYKDLMQREYIHQFEFLYDLRVDDKVRVIHYYVPECIKDLSNVE